MFRLGQWTAGLGKWRRSLLAAALGALAAAALPPLHLLPALPVAFTGLVWLLDGSARRRGAFAAGWWFGFGHFLAALYWIGNAFLVDAGKFGWMAPLAVAGLAAALAVFPALALLASHVVGATGAGRVLVLAAAWTIAEWLRAQLFTGFPWALVGYVWTLSDSMLQLTAAVGVYGLGLLTVAAAAMPATLADAAAGARPRWRPLAAMGAALVLVWSGGALRLAGAEVTEVPDVRLRLVQANIPQREKWRPDRIRANLSRHLQLTSGPGAALISHVIWPETAVPCFVVEDPAWRALLGGLVKADGLLLTGAPRAEGDCSGSFRGWNSIFAIDAKGAVVATYDKFHLVPFGEYLPFRPLLERFGLAKLAHGARDFSSGPGPRTLELPGLPRLSPLICFEVIFPDRVTERGSRPGWLLNLTNDAWFGISPGPLQHFAMARTRAVEQGLPLVRAAGTGISAIVDPYGRTVRSLGLGQSGVVDGALPMALAETPYARLGRLGDAPAVLLSLLCLVVAAIRRRR